MARTVLQLVQDTCAELGLAVPAQVVGATDDQTVQMLALINAVGVDLLTRKDWTALQTQAIINVPAALQGTGDTTVGSTAITNITGTDLASIDTPGDWVVSGTGIVNSSRLVTTSVGVPASATMDTPASATVTGQPLVFGRDTFAVPADFVTFINDTEWDRGNHWKLRGPASPQQDSWLRSGIVATGPRRWFRQVGRGQDIFRLWPPPGASDTPGPMVYEYLSSYWAQSAYAATPSGTVSIPKARFTADDDFCVFTDRLMTEGLKWRFFAAKGFDYSAQLALWKSELQVAMSRDGGSPVLSLNQRRVPMFISPAQVQDGFFPGHS